jgi:(2Fe-2S) ferredoxin
MADSKSIRFRCTGRVVGFVPGKKSLYKTLLLEAVQIQRIDSQKVDNIDLTEALTQASEFKVSRSLRKKMCDGGAFQGNRLADEIGPQDWVQVSGRGRFDAASGQMVWKVRRLAKAPEAGHKKDESQHLAPAVVPLLVSPATKKPSAKPMQVLICQKSSCRKRGSQAVKDAIAQVLTETGCSDQVKLKDAGCMSCCKRGPHVKLIPPRAQRKMPASHHQKVTPKKARSLIREALGASAILDSEPVSLN